MTRLVARHRAAAGIFALVAILLLCSLPEAPGSAGSGIAAIALDVLLVVIAAVGGGAILTSPYHAILYRESPLRRAVSGVSELDERELALRDRASGLTYCLFVLFNMILICAAAFAADRGWIVLDASTLLRALIPYACLASALPVLTLEWFEPSSLWAEPIEEEDL
jgi:hypothetical protein